MPVPTSFNDLNTNEASNFPQDTDITGSTVASLPRMISSLLKKLVSKGTNITITASGALTLPSYDERYYTVAGSGFNVTSISAAFAGREVALVFTGSLTLVNSASLILQGYNRVTHAGDVIHLVSDSPGVWRETYYKYSLGIPRCKMHRNNLDVGPFASGSPFKISFNTEAFDPYNIWNPGTGIGTIQEPGDYEITFQGTCATAGAIGVKSFVFKNGATLAYHSSPGVSGAATSSTVTVADTFAVGDTFEFYMQWDSGSNSMSGIPAFSYATMKKIA